MVVIFEDVLVDSEFNDVMIVELIVVVVEEIFFFVEEFVKCTLFCKVVISRCNDFWVRSCCESKIGIEVTVGVGIDKVLVIEKEEIFNEG